MKVTIVSKEDRASCPGVSFRNDRPGPEQLLVMQFLRTLQIKAPKGCQVTIFREPRIETNYPDIVIVVWHVATTQKWNEYRTHLIRDDIRIMHYLTHAGPSSTCQLKQFFPKDVLNSLLRLQAADMLRQDGKYWISSPLSKCFAARHIIAIEAKIRAWQGALDQAYINTWFASASYIIVPCVTIKSRLIDRANALGVSVQDMSASVLDTYQLPSERLPVSYASWLFNEWAWRISQHNIMETNDADGY